MQSKKHSHIEIWSNQIIGILAGLVVLHYLLPIVQNLPRDYQSPAVVFTMFVLSYSRSYGLRRLFNYIDVDEVMRKILRAIMWVYPLGLIMMVVLYIFCALSYPINLFGRNITLNDIKKDFKDFLHEANPINYYKYLWREK